MPSNEIMTALSQALATSWSDLAPEVQHKLYEAAVKAAGENAREELAIYLHHKHPRTIEGENQAQRSPG